jgi:hypothetical protein
MGSLPMYGQSSHLWEVFPYMEIKSCMVASMSDDQQHATDLGGVRATR